MKIYNTDGKVLFSSRRKTMEASLLDAIEKFAALNGADLSKLQLSNIKQQFLDLRDALLVRAKFDGVAVRVNLDRTNALGISVNDSALRGVVDKANFTGCILKSSGISVNGLQTNFTDAIISKCSIQGRLPASDFSKAYIADTTFKHSFFINSTFINAALSKVTFYYCNLKNADFTNALLSDVNFIGCQLYGAKLPHPSDTIFTSSGSGLGCIDDIQKPAKFIQMNNIDGSGRLINIYLAEDGRSVFIRAGCFFGTIQDFVRQACAEGKYGYSTIVQSVASGMRADYRNRNLSPNKETRGEDDAS